VRVTGAVAEKAFADLSSSKSAFRMNSEKGSPSGVFIGPNLTVFLGKAYEKKLNNF
jgi:hypothetical protein